MEEDTEEHMEEDMEEEAHPHPRRGRIRRFGALRTPGASGSQHRRRRRPERRKKKGVTPEEWCFHHCPSSPSMRTPVVCASGRKEKLLTTSWNFSQLLNWGHPIQ